MIENETSECPLSASQLRAVELLSGGSSVADVASELGWATVTVYRWRQVPAFQMELGARLAAIREAARDRLAASTDKAVLALVSVLDSENDGARVAAAKALFDRVGLEAPPTSTTTVNVAPSEAQQAQLSDTELRARVRRVVFAELQGLDPEAMAERVNAVLTGEEE